MLYGDYHLERSTNSDLLVSLERNPVYFSVRGHNVGFGVTTFYPDRMRLASITRIKRWIACLIQTSALLAGAANAVHGQPARPFSPPLIGTVAPGAIGPAVQQPPPIGGLRTTPLNAGMIEPRKGVPLYRHYPFVRDAALLRGGGVELSGDANARSTQYERDLATWYPTADRPRWRVDSLAERVDAWRDLLVNDVVCNGTGACLERITRLRARWSAFCSCYLFADALQRIWRVE